MQFQIPQFIDIENKIVGPLTLKQFLYLAAAGGLIFLLFFVFSTWLWFIISAILLSVAASFAFAKYNGQALPKVALHAFGFLWRPKLYLWQREKKEKTIVLPEVPEMSETSVIEKRKNLKEYFPAMPSVTKLWQDITTSKSPIPKREKPHRALNWSKPPKEKFTVLKKVSGEHEVARRVDYR